MKISDVTKKMIFNIVVLFFVLEVLGYFIRDTSALSQSFGEVTFMVYTIGTLYGCFFAVLRALSLDRTYKKSIEKTAYEAKNYAIIQYLLRYLLAGVALVIAALTPQIDLLGAILGILTLQFASYMAGFSIKDDEEFAAETMVKRKAYKDEYKKKSSFKKMKDEFKL